MNQELLRNAISEIQEAMHHAITSASYKSHPYPNGLEAKNALIRSESLIQRIHEVTKRSLVDELTRRGLNHKVHPPIGQRGPELNIWGFLKKKKQDIVITIGDAAPHAEKIDEGPLAGHMDQVGRQATEHSIVVGVRSQLSSVNKNFDTLMERTFAETLNLRLRHPRLVMGEVYLLAVKDYNDQLMKQNSVGWSNNYVDVGRFISIFNAFSGRDDNQDIKSYYKYERCLLLLADFSADPPKIYTSIDELREEGLVAANFSQDFSRLSSLNFSRDLVDAYVAK